MTEVLSKHVLQTWSFSLKSLRVCCYLDISSNDNLVDYFPSLNEATNLYELKGSQITKYDFAMSNNLREVQVLKWYYDQNFKP